MGLYDGGPVSDAQFGHLTAASARGAATAQAMRLLRGRPRSRFEITQALRRRGVDAQIAMAVVDDLQRAGWIDDAKFARLWVRDRLALRPSGRRRLRLELIARGVSTPLVEDALAEILPIERESDVALAQAQRRAARLANLPPDVATRRLAGWLQRRGFSGEVVASVIRAIRRGAARPDA